MQMHRKSIELNIAQKQKKNTTKGKEQSIKLQDNQRFLLVKSQRGNNSPGKVTNRNYSLLCAQQIKKEDTETLVKNLKN